MIETGETGETAMTVGEVARLARVTVRTLHHYDDLGLLTPSGRTRADYRLYAERDLERLQVILFFRELGFALADIGRILAGPSYARRDALLAQRELLADKARRIEAMLGSIDAALAALEDGRTMDKNVMFEVFGDFDHAQYEAEVADRWGDSGAFRESARRTPHYSKGQWAQMKAAGDEIERGLARHLASGAAADEPAVMDLVERHRLLIDRWFYPCSHDMHVGLGEMYVSDPRFGSHYEALQPGLSLFVRDAIRANAERSKAIRST